MLVLYHLVKQLDDKKADEVAVLLITRIILIPIVFALSPKSHSVDP